MFLRIQQRLSYYYEAQPRFIVQAFRLWPASTPLQTVRRWEVRVNGDAVVPTSIDGFSNPTATHTVLTDTSSVHIEVGGEVNTVDRAGVHGLVQEYLPPAFFLAETRLTKVTPAMSEFAREDAKSGPDLERLHRLCSRICDHMDYAKQVTNVATTAAEAFAHRAGVCQDYAHIMVAVARLLGFPARYVSGYLCPIPSDTPATSHAWMEAHVPDLGWVGFDPVNSQSPDEHYVRIACGRDYLDAAPVRGIHRGGAGEMLDPGACVVVAGQENE